MSLYNPSQELEDFLKAKNQPYDFGYRKSLYEGMKLGDKLGEFRGEKQQSTATLNLLKAEESLGRIGGQIGDIKTAVTGLAKLKEMGFPENANIYTGGEPIEGQLKVNPNGSVERWIQTGESDEMSWQPTSAEIESTAPHPVGYEPPEVLEPAPQPPVLAPEDVSLSDTDITNIINDFSTGALSTPELEISKAKFNLATEDQKSAAAKALSQFQQSIAKRGMAFSSIRSGGEESLAAESMSKMTGLSLDMSAAIISAARNEQQNRQKALKAQQDAADSALKARGYIMNPFTGTLEKTLERERFEKEEYRELRGGLYNVSTNTWIIPPEEDTFTNVEMRKLEQAGIDWKAEGGYQQALDFLYGEEAVSAPSTLKDIAKLGYIRRGATDGGYNFYKNGKPITAEQIVQETGISITTLLAGSLNPADKVKLDVAVDPFEIAIQNAILGASK